MRRLHIQVLAFIRKNIKTMKTKIILTLILCLTFSFSYAQNERTNREEFTQKLPVDKEQFYGLKVENDPYFVK